MSRRSPRAFFDDQIQYSLQIVSNVRCKNPQRENSLPGKPGIPANVTLRVGTEVVRKAINFDPERGFMAKEVENVWPKRMLTTELEI